MRSQRKRGLPWGLEFWFRLLLIIGDFGFFFNVLNINIKSLV